MNYRVLIAAEKLYHNLNREAKNMGDFPLKFSDSGIKYRGYIIFRITINKCGQNNASKLIKIWGLSYRKSIHPLRNKRLTQEKGMFYEKI